MNLRATLLVLLVLVGSGCAPTEVDRTPSAADVTGQWSGGWKRGSGSGSATLRLQQTGSKVVGEISIPGFASLSGQLEGSIAGNHFSYHLLNGHGGGEMTINGDEMSGYGTSTGSQVMFQRQK